MEQERVDFSLLWASPLPPTRSGVADYAIELLPELAKLVRLRVLEPPGWKQPDNWPPEIETVPADTLADTDDILLAHLGNNPHHHWILNRLGRTKPTVVVLHDAVLHHLLVESTAAVGDDDGYRERLGRAHGKSAEALAAARMAGHHGHLDPFLFPARQPFLDGAGGVIVHSRWAMDLIRAEHPGIAVGRIDLSVADPAPVDREWARDRLHLAADDVVLMHLGFLTPEKGLEAILTGAAAAVRAGIRVRLIVLGEGKEMGPIRLAADSVGLGDHLVVTGWVEPEVFPGLPAAADLGVVYRTPSAGETSAAALRFLACGVPVAVGGVHQFLEWPEVVAPRLTPGPSAAADLVRLLAEVGSPGWETRGLSSRHLYERKHRPEIAAREMVDFLGRELRR